MVILNGYTKLFLSKKKLQKTKRIRFIEIVADLFFYVKISLDV